MLIGRKNGKSQQSLEEFFVKIGEEEKLLKKGDKIIKINGKWYLIKRKEKN